MQTVRSAVIAAAGLGSRIGLGMPKCMIEIDGMTILTRLLTALRPHVSVIHLVVGYREEMVIEYCGKNHPDVVLVRNPNYRTTNTAYSLAIGAKHLKGKVLFLDGDLLISPDSLTEFFGLAEQEEILIGLTDSKSENAVFVQGDRTNTIINVSGFTRENRTLIEWANIVSGPSTLMNEATGYVYERLIDYLPLPGYLLKLSEVDTSDDLDAAIRFAQDLTSE